MDIETINQERDQIKSQILTYQKNIFDLENKLIQLEKKLASFSEEEILNTLNLSPQQQAIVDATEDNILVVACPGSGKTHTLISRYVKMVLTNKIKPEETLLITFTKKAGMEMLNRLSNILPSKLPKHVGSLHGFSYKVLQEVNDINYSVLDEKDVKEYLKDLMSDNTHMKHLEEGEIELIKSKVHAIVDMASTSYPFDIKPSLKKHNLEKYYKEFNHIVRSYQAKKKKENLVDFNDLMLLFCKYLDDKKSEEFRNNIKYIFFDEYQDVNMIQNYILKKLAEKSQVMVVGDDAQAIYAFRGSSVQYILNFNKEFDMPNKTSKMYLLEENYRSTPCIVDFCQDIISHNINQFKKIVKSKQDKVGLKPNVIGFKSNKEQYEWIVNDIMSKNAEGIKFSEMVVLARKNNLLNEIELPLIGQKIPISKHLGLSLLDKSHIKDFLAFVTILINTKSSIHWKRIISLHPGYGIKRANIILDSGSDIMANLKAYIMKEKVANPNYIGLSELYDAILLLKSSKSPFNKDYDKAKFIINYLEKLWLIKKELNIGDKIQDINNLLSYLKSSSLAQFINDLYLNQEVETNLDNVLYLTTVHGAKGLEWSYVYIIDVDCKNFPSIRPKYYMDEFEENDEERRLFYVAASRAKKYLYITYCDEGNNDNIVTSSPFIGEINQSLYSNYGNIKTHFIPSLIISQDISNYIRMIGYDKLSEYMNNISNSRTINNKPFDIPKQIEKLPNKTIIGNFIDYLISKMLQVNFPNKMVKFDLNIVHRDNKFPQKIYLEYIDKQTDWRNLLEHIFYISTYKIKNMTESTIELYKEFLVSQESYNYYLELEKGICRMINNIKPKEIHTHYVVSHGSVRGEIDCLCDNTIIEIKSSCFGEIATVPYISQTLLYGYLLKKKNIDVKQIILYNPISGEMNNMDISKINVIKFKKTIYSNNNDNSS
jgi:DNA helicase-2/ATP-dependent DNA helicase PcrA